MTQRYLDKLEDICYLAGVSKNRMENIASEMVDIHPDSAHHLDVMMDEIYKLNQVLRDFYGQTQDAVESFNRIF